MVPCSGSYDPLDPECWPWGAASGTSCVLGEPDGKVNLNIIQALVF